MKMTSRSVEEKAQRDKTQEVFSNDLLKLSGPSNEVTSNDTVSKQEWKPLHQVGNLHLKVTRSQREKEKKEVSTGRVGST